MKTILLFSISILLISAGFIATGCFSSPTQSVLVIGYCDKRVSIAPKANTPAGTETPATGHGNGSIALVDQAQVVYKSPMSANSNSVSPTVEIPIK